MAGVLISRLLTALALLPLLLGAIWFLPPPALYVVFCVAGMIAAWEWAGLTGAATRAPFVAVCAACMVAAWLLRDHWIWFCTLAALWWLYAIHMVATYPANFARFSNGRPPPAAMGVIGLVLLVPTMLALWRLHTMPDGALRLFYLFFLIFAADTGAYLAGRNLGRHKLAPAVSPGKTVEGMAGGLLLCAAWAVTAGTWVFRASSPQEIGLIVLLSLGVALMSVIGDLSESLFKRAAGVKDSGTLLPGHGGMLDRVDSIVAGAPILALGLSLGGI